MMSCYDMSAARVYLKLDDVNFFEVWREYRYRLSHGDRLLDVGSGVLDVTKNNLYLPVEISSSTIFSALYHSRLYQKSDTYIYFHIFEFYIRFE